MFKNNVGISVVRLSSNDYEQHAFMKLGNCIESPTQIWRRHNKSKEACVGAPKTLGRTRKALKFIVNVMKNHLDMESINEILLKGKRYDDEDDKKGKVKKKLHHLAIVVPQMRRKKKRRKIKR